MRRYFARPFRAAVVAATVLASGSSARAAVLTFEELDPGYASAAPLQRYAGFTWTGWSYVARSGPGPALAPGYYLGTRGYVAAYTPGGAPGVIARPEPFSLHAAYVTAARDWSEDVTVEGLRGGVAVYTSVISVSWLPQQFQLGFTDVDAVRFTPSGRDITVDDVDVTTSPDTVPPTIEIVDVPAVTGYFEVVVHGFAHDQDGSTAGLSGTIRVGGAATAVLVDPASGWFQATVPLAEGANDLVVEIGDAWGNVGRRLIGVTRDSTPPVLVFLTPTDGASIGTLEFPVQVRVVDATAVTLMIGDRVVPVVDGVATTTLTVPYREGGFFVYARATDAVGFTTIGAVQAYAALPDLDLVADVASGSVFGPLSGALLPVRLTVVGPYPASLIVSSGQSFEVPAGGGTFEASVPLVEGQNLVWAAVLDLSGQSASLPLFVLYDATPPVARFRSPVEGAVVAGTVEVALEATDAITGVAGASLSVDGGVPSIGAGGPIWIAALDLGGLSDGPHTISAVVGDGVGNVATPSVGVIVDATPPSLSIVSPLPGAYARGTLSVSAVASDATSAVRSIRLLANGTQIAACEATACEATLDTTALPDGPFVVAAVASDLAGNEALAQAMVLADNSAPSRFLLAPAPGQVVAGSVEIAVEVQDPGFAWAECSAGGVGLGRSLEPAFRVTADVTSVLDGPLDVACTAVDLAGNAATERATVTVRNWTLTLEPRVLAASANPGDGAVVTLYVEGRNVALLAPASTHALALAVPGGSPVPLVPRAAGERVGDADRDGIPDLTLHFERAALVSAIRGGVAAGAVAPGAPVPVRLLDGDRTLGVTAIEVR